MPIRLALYNGDPGAIAAMDPELIHAKMWVSAAQWDADNKVRLTAIKALGNICRDALAAQKLEVAQRAVDEAHRLRKRTEENIQRRGANESYADAGQVRQQRELQLEYRDALTELAELYSVLSSNGWPTRNDEQSTAPKDSRVQRMQLLADAVGEIKSVNRRLGLEAEEPLVAHTDEPAVQSTAESARIVEQAKEEVDKQRSVVGTDSATDSRIQELIALLRSEVQDLRRSARVELGLIGQPAVARLIGALKDKLAAGQKSAGSFGDYKTRLGVAVAFSRMKQPIQIQVEEDMALVVALLRVKDAETRVAAADFLMDLEDPETIRTAFKEVQKVVSSTLDPKEDGHAIMNSSVVMGTWARGVPETVLGIAGKPLREEALAVAKQWLQDLRKSPYKADWTKTIETLESLVGQAEKVR